MEIANMDAEESWHDSIYSIYNETAHSQWDYQIKISSM